MSSKPHQRFTFDKIASSTHKSSAVAFGHPYLCTPILLEFFEQNPSPNYHQVTQIISRTSLKRKQITSWFWRKRKENVQTNTESVSLTSDKSSNSSSSNLNQTQSQSQSPHRTSFDDEYESSKEQIIRRKNSLIDHHRRLCCYSFTERETSKPRVIRCTLRSHSRPRSPRPESVIKPTVMNRMVNGSIAPTRGKWSGEVEAEERSRSGRTAAIQSLYQRTSTNPRTPRQLSSGLRGVPFNKKSSLGPDWVPRRFESGSSWAGSFKSEGSGGLGVTNVPSEEMLNLEEGAVDDEVGDSESNASSSEDSIEDYSSHLESVSIANAQSNSTNHRRESMSSSQRVPKKPILSLTEEVEADPVLYSTPYRPFWKRWDSMLRSLSTDSHL
ncbi:hypothetical protein CROQUDRAFT_651348 [Cronartium quercuum f. sp. fusiforme G11]|uniref:Homeobox domain-containing protein n=1 Tax=Cronartium quercuum f. sp. fusiforme G11 TaxID=708437 RepID=A0A9P6TGV9_9BASI|nr:hypothetical protein CROQUDRAFT_651348 [Cronartium quercuum f. sp. fusiforme G11]